MVQPCLDVAGATPYCEAVDFLFKVVSDVKAIDPDLAAKLEAKVLPAFAGPGVFHVTFEHEVTSAKGEVESTVPEGEVVEATDSNILEELKADLNKGAQHLADIFHGIYTFRYDASLKSLASCSPRDFVDSLEGTASGPSAVDAGELGKGIREMMRLLVHHQPQTVTTVQGSAPAMGLRQLARIRSNPEDTNETAKVAERESVWKQAVSQRKRFATLSVLKARSNDGLTAAFRLCGAVQSFKGVPNEAHRVFVLSADLLEEKVGKAWLSLSTAAKSDMETCNYLKTVPGPTDFVVVFDGRSRDSRRIVQDCLQSAPHFCELFILYAGKSVRAGRTRKTPFASATVETGCVLLPVQASRVQLQKREHSNACRESSTWHNTYSGATFRKTSEVPLIVSEEKAAVLRRPEDEELPEGWADKRGHSVPLFGRSPSPSTPGCRFFRTCAPRLCSTYPPVPAAAPRQRWQWGCCTTVFVAAPVRGPFLQNVRSVDGNAVKAEGSVALASCRHCPHA
jgi:hypothetical protein